MSKPAINDQFLGHDIPTMDEKGLRQFGLMFAGIISILFGIVLPFLFDYGFPWWPWIVAGVFCILALAVPTGLKQFYRLWMRFGVIMNIIMSRLILGSVFVLTVIPTGMILRLQKKDILNLKMDSESQSYRVESDSNDSDSLKKPY
jgi:hypothetical protein